ncbi:DUF6444 domain-containing protein [Nannocystis exedens]|uniref:DUF6444 domain-containing protein n=1 Tax=Nannocystis exedens TaxID=54 RepID=UPI0014728616|nr:DUF6444 domain-containing protein [Nannocystis exedens]
MTELEAKDRRIAELEARVAELEAQLAEVVELVRDLKARLGRNSMNSSLPPSRDGADARASRTRKPKSKRRRGGQKGHQRSMRELAPPGEVDEIYHIRPTVCEGCKQPLRGDDPAPSRRQVIELPEVAGPSPSIASTRSSARAATTRGPRCRQRRRGASGRGWQRWSPC